MTTASSTIAVFNSIEPSTCPEHGAYMANVIKVLGKQISQPCPKCQARLTEADKARVKAIEAEGNRLRTETLLSQSGIPLRFKSKTLDGYDAKTEEQERALRIARAYVQDWTKISERGTCLIFTGNAGTGKALCLNTKIPTPSGWTTMGNIKVGDKVFDENGGICNVTFATEVQYDRNCFDVKFSDGTVIIADEEHLWSTQTKNERKYSCTGQVRATKDILNTLHQNHSVKVAGALDLDESELPIDPYVLGVWLGDGDSKRAYLTCVEPELVSHVEQAGCSMSPISSGTKAQRYGMGQGSRMGHYNRTSEQYVDGDSLQCKIRNLGLLSNKHIPTSYLRSSIEQRTALLQGLMDTDGYIDHRTGSCEVVSSIYELSHDIFELVVSLGIKATMNESDSKVYGRVVGRRWRICFNPGINVFRLTRKLEKINKNPRSTIKLRYIVSITPRETTPVRCIQVDSDSRLYLASDAMIATHNTHLACAIATEVIGQGASARFIAVIDALRLVKRSYDRTSSGTEDDAIAELVKPRLLILDEVGADYGTEHSKTILFDIINKRYENIKPTIVLTNLDAAALREYFGERIVDRLREGGGKLVTFTWVSHRS